MGRINIMYIILYIVNKSFFNPLYWYIYSIVFFSYLFLICFFDLINFLQENLFSRKNLSAPALRSNAAFDFIFDLFFFKFHLARK